MKRKRPIIRIVLWALILGTVLLPASMTVAADGIDETTRVHLPVGTGAVVGDIRVVIDAAPARQPAYAAMARRLIRLSPGDPLTEATVRESIEALKLSHRFSKIHVDSTPTARGETLIFTLTPYGTVEDIRIRGNYPIFESDILNQMTLYPGDPYNPADLPDQREAIIARYKRAGYIDPRVSVRSRQQADDGKTVIIVDIDKGTHFVLGRLIFEGNRAISNTALKWHMSIWRADLLPAIGRFSEYKLKKDMTALANYYRRKGFVDAELSYRTAIREDGRHVDVTIRIHEGDRYTVSFEGNRRFWDLTLKKDVTLFTDSNPGQFAVRKSIRNIKQRYREDGYLETRIDVETSRESGSPVGRRHLRFVIREGPQTVVEAVKISGNRAITDKQIKEQILTRPPSLLHDGAYVPETLEEDVYAVTTLYMQRGFEKRTVDSKVALNEEKTLADIRLTIDEGPRTIVRSITIDGLNGGLEKAARAALIHRIGEPFRQAALEEEKETITSLVSEKGYPYVTVRTDVSYSQDHTRADIVHTVDPGVPVTLGGIFISGNLKTDESVIRRELEVEPGMPLSLQALQEGQRRLRDLAIFNSVSYRTIGLREKADTVNLFVDIEERKPYYAQVSTGYQSDSGLFGRTKVGDHNLFGLNKDLWASGEVSETGYRLETRLTEPRFLGTRVTASIGAFNEELTEFNQPFGTRTTGGSLGFGKEWGRHLASALSFRLERKDQFSVEDRPAGEADEETRTNFVTTPYLSYDSRDSFVRPTRGFLSSLSVDISKGIQNQLDDFLRYELDTRYFVTPFERVTFAGLARIGQVISYSGTSEVPDDQLFYLGGIRDVRGFKENLLRFDQAGNPVGGKKAMVGSLEARIDLGLNFELTTFFDIGSVQNTQVEGGSDRFRSSIGLGLRYITPIGPMGLLYGYKLDREEGESAGRFHLSIGYSF